MIRNGDNLSRRGSRGFTLIELLVVIAVIGILAAILLPALSSSKKRAWTAVCQNNMKQIGAAWLFYANDHRGKMVPQSAITTSPPEDPIGPTGEGTHYYWPDLMRDYLKKKELLVCPGFRIPNGTGIGYNTPEFGIYQTDEVDPLRLISASAPSMTDIAEPGASVVFADSSAISNPDEPDPDLWKPTKDGSLTMGLAGVGAGVPGAIPGVKLGPEYNVYFRSPSDSSYKAIPHRLINRHGGKANTWFAAGNVELRKASSIGFQHPRESDGKPNPLWLWDR